MSESYYQTGRSAGWYDRQNANPCDPDKHTRFVNLRDWRQGYLDAYRENVGEPMSANGQNELQRGFVIRRVRLVEPLGGVRNGEQVIVPEGYEGMTAKGERGFNIVIDRPGDPLDMTLCPDVMGRQVEVIA